MMADPRIRQKQVELENMSKSNFKEEQYDKDMEKENDIRGDQVVAGTQH